MTEKTRVLLIGANGFIGSNVYLRLKKDYEILATGNGSRDFIELDLLDKQLIVKVFNDFKPDVIVSCAGIVQNNENAKLNIDFTKNILESLTEINIKPKVILCGSASVYGIVEPKELPVNENCSRNPYGFYAEAKKAEEDFAVDFGSKNNINVVVLRIFNPIGKGMKERFLITSLVSQINEVKTGKKNAITVNRLDAMRDFLDIRDLSEAIATIVSSKNQHHVYNVGSGITVSVKQVIDKILELNKMNKDIEIIQTGDAPEPIYAGWADISRIRNDIGWKPMYNLESSIKEIL